MAVLPMVAVSVQGREPRGVEDELSTLNFEDVKFTSQSPDWRVHEGSRAAESENLHSTLHSKGPRRDLTTLGT